MACIARMSPPAEKAPAPPGKHYGADFGIPPRLVNTAQQAIEDCVVDRIELLRTIEPDVQHAFAQFALDKIGHKQQDYPRMADKTLSQNWACATASSVNSLYTVVVVKCRIKSVARASSI